MGMFEVIKSEELNEAFESNQRQYLTGMLAKEQFLNYIKDENVEIGMSRYKEYNYEKPHYHTEVAEYHLILKGETKYVNIEENKELVFKEGDFYIIRPNTTYIQKSLEGTELMFIKVPGKNDKVSVPSNEKIDKWFISWQEKW
ncbi:MAG: cupin domain-containing protein [Sarcina sp.]